MNFSGIDYLKIDVSNAMGNDKMLWEDRLDWFNFNEHRLQSLVSKADNKFLFTKALHAYEETMNNIPVGHIMALDATASGLQILSCMAGCMVGASNCNLIFTGKGEDFYTNLLTTMNNYLPTDKQNQYTRKEVKIAGMTVFYNSKAEPKKAFGEDTLELEAFYKALEKLAPLVMAIMPLISSHWDRNTLTHSWTLPDQHRAVVPVKTNVKIEKIALPNLNAKFNMVKTINGVDDTPTPLLANVTHSVDSWVVREMVIRAKLQSFNLVTIHDAYYAMPQYMNRVRQNYKDILAELADMNLLDSILKELDPKSMGYTKPSNNLSDLIRDSEYALS